MSRLTIGLTGGIGSGKSIVADEFKKLGATVIDADEIARDIVSSDSQLLQKISAKFGKEILNPDKSLNRKLLRDKIFKDKEAKTWLERLLHPVIIEKMLDCANKAQSPYCVLVVPLLIEIDLINIVDRILVVDTTEELQKKRTMNRDKITESEVAAIIKSQATRKQRIEIANDVIKNVSTINELKKQVAQMHQKYLNLVKLKIS